MKIIDFDLDPHFFQQNQNLLRNMLRSLFEAAYPDLANQQVPLHESVYDEPLLYYHLLGSKAYYPIEQITAGYHNLSAEKPRLGDLPHAKDIHGKTYFPGIGYLDTSENGLLDKTGGREWLGKTEVELYKFVPNIILDHDPSVNYCPSDLADGYRNALTRAFEKMRLNTPEFFELICMCTKNICLFKSDNLNSFAGITQHGTCFINIVEDDASEVFFMDDLAHQCGHIIFNILTAKTEDFLKFDKTTLIRDLGGFDADDRNIYSIFHGLFTYSCILSSLDAYLENTDAEEQPLLRLEAFARLGFYVTKMFVDLENLYGKNLFTPLGETYYAAFIKNYQCMYDKYHTTIKTLPFANQPYVFSFEQFLKDYTS